MHCYLWTRLIVDLNCGLVCEIVDFFVNLQFVYLFLKMWTKVVDLKFSPQFYSSPRRLVVDYVDFLWTCCGLIVDLIFS